MRRLALAMAAGLAWAASVGVVAAETLVVEPLACGNRPDELRFAFCRDSGGWAPGFADLPTGELQGELFDLSFRRERVPGAGAQPTGLRLAGSNRSDDLFMFVTRQVTGLAPGERYKVTLRFQLYTNAGRGCVGIGGAPGESVFVKAGATAREPRAVRREGAFVMNVDKGNQSRGGEDAIVAGDLASAGANCFGRVFAPKRFEADLGGRRADADGNLWLLIGTDSGHEGRTTVYLTRVEAELTPDEPCCPPPGEP